MSNPIEELVARRATLRDTMTARTSVPVSSDTPPSVDPSGEAPLPPEPPRGLEKTWLTIPTEEGPTVVLGVPEGGYP